MTDEDAAAPAPATFRVAPAVSLFAVAFFALCLSPIAFQGGAWFLLFGVPVLAAAWILRVRTVVDTAGVHVRGEVGTRSLPWSELATLRLPAKGWVRAVAQADGRELTLRGVRIRDLGRIGEASGGRITAPTPAEAAAAEEREREIEAIRMRAAALREQQERLREQEGAPDDDAAPAPSQQVGDDDGAATPVVDTRDGTEAGPGTRRDAGHRA